MAKNKHYQKTSPQTEDEALKMAKATQRSGQTKEQTKLIAQGVEKAISHYKKQQKEKSRELNKKINKVSHQLDMSEKAGVDKREEVIVYKQSILAWSLLLISWLGFGVYYVGTVN